MRLRIKVSGENSIKSVPRKSTWKQKKIRRMKTKKLLSCYLYFSLLVPVRCRTLVKCLLRWHYTGFKVGYIYIYIYIIAYNYWVVRGCGFLRLTDCSSNSTFHAQILGYPVDVTLGKRSTSSEAVECYWLSLLRISDQALLGDSNWSGLELRVRW